MASELVTSDAPSAAVWPGGTQYLLSLAQVAVSAGVDIPELWDSSGLTTLRLLRCLLRCPLYEVRELAVDRVLGRLKEEEVEDRRPRRLDETTLSNLTSLALHETHPLCLAKVRPHTATQKPYRRCVCVCLKACMCVCVSECFIDVSVRLVC